MTHYRPIDLKYRLQHYKSTVNPKVAKVGHFSVHRSVKFSGEVLTLHSVVFSRKEMIINQYNRPILSYRANSVPAITLPVNL